ncbi:MAG: hypothetical protein J0M26_20840 [Planctomycetes bacterium]|nr:hypothetical protein [Planctomycetota bacterium]
MIVSNRIAVIATLIVLAVLSRLIPHPPNFAAVGAVGLFAGASLGNRWLSLLIPISAMIISDVAIGLHWMCIVIYLSMALYVVAGWWAGYQIDAKRLIAASLAASIGFFVITNFACWLTMYERSWAGFASCYVAAVPFFQDTLLSDFVFGLVLFGALRFAESRLPALRPVIAKEAIA